MTANRQDAEKKAKALLKHALNGHNAKRYNEAAGLYELILKRYPDTEAAQFAQTNLTSLVNKVDGVKAVLPEDFDEVLGIGVEQSTAPDFQPAPAPVANRTAIEETARQRKLEAAIADSSRAQPVVVVDVHMRFWSMVWFMVKAAFAAIPALIITTLIMWALIAFLSGFLKGVYSP